MANEDEAVSPLTEKQFSLIAFALQEATRSLEHQQSELDRLRERVVAQLAYATALATFVLGTLLGEDPKQDGEFYFFMIIATVFAVGAAWLAWRVWRPAERWSQKIAAPTILEDYVSELSFSRLHRLALFCQRSVGIAWGRPTWSRGGGHGFRVVVASSSARSWSV